MNILVTGAGGAAAISVWKALRLDHQLFMADMDPLAAGLYLVPAERRTLVPSGEDTTYVSTVLNFCKQHQITLLIPTVDTELLPLAEKRDCFSQEGIELPISSKRALELCRDKYQLLTSCENTDWVPSFHLLGQDEVPHFDFPCFAKPRLGAGSRGIQVIHDSKELRALPKDESYLLQELLPGDEYSVDVYISSTGVALAAVPRLRLKIDSGIAVACQTKIMPELSALALKIAKKVGITFVANVQFKADSHKQFKLLEINPRFPGTLPLTQAAGINIPELLIKDINKEPLSTELLAFKELMVVRYWTEHFFPIEEWRNLCP